MDKFDQNRNYSSEFNLVPSHQASWSVGGCWEKLGGMEKI